VSGVVHRGALAIHPGALGDVLLAVPALRRLRETDGTVTLAAQPPLARLVAALGEADEARDLESLRLDALFAGDAAAALPPVARVVCWLGSRDPAFVGRLRAQAPGAVVAPSVADGLVWQHLLATCGGTVSPARAPIRVPPALVEAGRGALGAAGWDGARRLVVAHAGAGGVAKRWPTDGFRRVLDDVTARGASVVLHEGPADAEAVEALAPGVPSAVRLRRPELTTLAGALSLAAAYVGNDSGVSHLAAAIGTPAVILFAAANLGWRPWAREPEVITVTPAGLERDIATVRAALARRLA
jgi:ADP-heptose:LPS heptosyltransferase